MNSSADRQRSDGLLSPLAALTATLLTLALLLIAEPGALAAEGRIPIFEPIVLDANAGPIDGRYVVTRDILGSSGSAAIRIIGTGIEDVEIDLNGFTVRSGAAGRRVIQATNLKRLRLMNGSLEATVGATVPALSAALNDRIAVHNLSVSGGQEGMLLDGVVNVSIKKSIVLATESNGIRVLGGNAAAPVHALIEGNLVRDVGGTGAGIIALNNISTLVIRDNRVERVGGAGIFGAPGGAMTIINNTVEQAGLRGLVADRTLACSISDNVVNGSGTDGIYLTSRVKNCQVRLNVASGNLDNGLLILGDKNFFEQNTCNDNGKAGIALVSSAEKNVFSKNMARDNGTPTGTCSMNPGCTGLSTPDYCDDGIGNSSFGDNMAPGPPIC